MNRKLKSVKTCNVNSFHSSLINTHVCFCNQLLIGTNPHSKMHVFVGYFPAIRMNPDILYCITIVTPAHCIFLH